MSFLQLVLSLDKTKDGFNFYFADSVILTHIATMFVKSHCQAQRQIFEFFGKILLCFWYKKSMKIL